jgi:hypothetical protein
VVSGSDVGGQLAGVVGLDAVRLGWQVVAARVGCDDAESRRCERLDLPPPAVPELREAVPQNDQRPIACLDVMQSLLADLGVSFTVGWSSSRRRGVLAQGGDLSRQEAFDRLRRYVRNHNARLSEVARQVVETDLAAGVLNAPTAHSRAANQR